jgi:acyl-CoA synthetase (AMP-forming)/AMP-acid ligase II
MKWLRMDFLLHHLLRAAAERRPDRPGLICGAERLTYEDAWSESVRLAGGLNAWKLGRFDRVVVWLSPCLPQALSLFAVSAAGGVAVPLHESLFPRQVAHVVGNCEPTWLITSVRQWQTLRPLAAELRSLKAVLLVDAGGAELEAVRAGDADPASPLPVLGWDDLLAGAAEPSAERSTDKDLAAILYTSGSTGRPKGVMLSHANVIAGASIVSDYLGITEHDRLLGVLPLSFDAGLNQLTTAVQQAGTYILFSFVLANQIVKALQSEQITGLAGVPTLWNLLVKNGSFQRGTFPALRYVTNTGGAMPEATLAQLQTVLPGADIFSDVRLDGSLPQHVSAANGTCQTSAIHGQSDPEYGDSGGERRGCAVPAGRSRRVGASRADRVARILARTGVDGTRPPPASLYPAGPSHPTARLLFGRFGTHGRRWFFVLRESARQPNQELGFSREPDGSGRSVVREWKGSPGRGVRSS